MSFLCGSSSNTSTSQSGPPAQFTAAYNNLLNQAGGIASQPLQQYSGNMVAGLSPDQQAAIQTIQNTQGIANPFINAASQDFGQSTTPITTGAPGIASAAGTQANSAAGQYGAGAVGAAAGAGSAATGTAANAAGSATGSAGAGIDMATSGAAQNAARANAAAGTGVWNQVGPVTGQQIGAYESPYTQNVVNSTQAQFNNQNAQTNQGIIGNAISQGAWGGDRAGVAQGIAAGQEALAQAPVIAGLENQGYTQALQEANTQQALKASTLQSQAGLEASTALGAGNLLTSAGLGAGQLGANTAINAGNLGVNAAIGAGNLGIQSNLGAGNLGAQTALGAGNLGVSAAGQDMSAQQANDWLSSQAGFGEANLGNEAQNTALTGAQAQMSAGNLEQGIQQEQLNIPYEQFLQQQAYPFQSLSWLSGIDTGLGSVSGGTSSTTAPGPSLFQQILGPAASLGGAAILASDERVKEDVSVVGKTKDGQKIYRFRYKGDPTFRMGLMAQEVEKKHPGAVHEMPGGIKGVDYKAATEGSIRKAAGGGITNVPDVSISFIPAGGIAAKGGGPPAPPRPDSGATSEKGLGDLSNVIAMSKFKGAGSGSNGINGDYAQGSYDQALSGLAGSNTDFDSALGASMDSMPTFRTGGGIDTRMPVMRRAAGGGAGGGGIVIDDSPSFTSSTRGGNGVFVPQLSTALRSKPGIPANLTSDYGSTAADSKGKSTLPSTTFWPSAEPWASNPSNPNGPPVPQNLPPNGMSPEFYEQFYGRPYDGHASGGGVRSGYDDGGDDEFMAPTNDYEGDSDGGITGGGPPAPPPAAAPFQAHPIEQQPDGAHVPAPDGDGGIAPSRYATSYKPREAPQVDEAANKKEALGMALLLGGAGMMSSRSPHGIQALGEGIQAGAKGYLGTRAQQKAQTEKEAEQADTGAYRKGTLDQNAQKFSDEIGMKRDQIAQTGKHIENQDAIAADSLTERTRADKAREANAIKPHWVPAGIDGEGNMVYLNANSKNAEPETYTAKGVKPKPATAKAGNLSPMAVHDLAMRGIGGEPITTFIGNSPADKAAVLNEISEIASTGKIPPAQITAAVVQLQADKAGARSLAQFQGRVESSVVEADKFADNALAQSQKVNRTKYIPINVALNAYEKNTGDPEVIKFGFFNNSLINAYATAVGKGVKTDADTQEARHLLSIAQSPQQYAAAISALKMETHAAQAAPDMVRERMAARIAGRNPFAATTNKEAIGGAATNELPLDANGKVDRTAIKPDGVYRTKLGDKTGKELLGQ